MGGAWVWAPYMRYLAARGVTSYAVSYRGHGESWCPSFLRMLYGVTIRDLGDDLLAGIRAVREIYLLDNLYKSWRTRQGRYLCRSFVYTSFCFRQVLHV